VPGGAAGICLLLERLTALPADALNMHWRDWTPRQVAATHKADLRAFGWDAQSEAAVEHLLELGVDGLYADHPDLLVARVWAARARADGGTAGAE